MEATWFTILALMLATYVVLDGFDLGAGVLHLLVARTDHERREVIASIGPVWDGNEVWLLASGGVLVFSFPKVYAVGFSGFYLPLMMVLWLLVMRGLSIEFRSKEESHLWRSFWDGLFALSSVLLAIILGAALGNVIRGVPIGADGYFAGPLFTDFRLGATPGVLDWFTVSLGVFTLVTLAGHGALYLALKTTGPVYDRSRALAGSIWAAVAVLWVAATALTALVRPIIFTRIAERPWAWILPLCIAGSLIAVFVCHRRRDDLKAFLASTAFIASLLAATAAGFYPDMLISTVSPEYSLTAPAAANDATGLRVGLFIWLPAVALAAGYFWYLFRSFRGKVQLDEGGYGH